MLTSWHRPTQAVISLPAIIQNYRTFEHALPKGTKLFTVIKADAYGHGAVQVAKALIEQTSVYGFCVATLDEGLILREAGISHPILVLGITSPQYAKIAAEQHISLTISSKEWIEAARLVLDNQSLTVHLKVDSGMGRIGVRSKEEGQGIIDAISQDQSHFDLEGIFTHYATADEDSEKGIKKVHNQEHKFESLAQAFDYSKLSHRPYFHQSNTALSLWYPEDTLDAIRLGIGLYGINPSNDTVPLPEELALTPAFRLETELVFVKKMHEGETISYGATYTAKEGEWIGTLPIGYADGLIRKYSGFNVLVDGNYCPIVGRVCMDQCLIRLPHDFPVGTTVTLIGQDKDKEITAVEFSQYVDTIAYESLCLINDRVPRRYI